MSSNNSTILDKDVIINDLVTSTRLEATQMFLGLKSAVTSDEAKIARDKAFDACQEAESEAAYQAQMLQEDFEHLQSLKEKIDEKKLQEAHALLKQKQELIDKITAAEAELAGVNVEHAKQLLAENAKMEERLEKIRQENDHLRQIINFNP